MCPIVVPALLHALRLLLPLVACVWAPAVASPNWSVADELVHLYTSSSRFHFFLEIHPNGRVDRSQSETVDTALIIKPVTAENVMIMGARSGLHLCMHSDGSLFGSRSFSEEDCVFKHTLIETNYDIYESVKHKFLVSLGSNKGSLVPNRSLPRFSQFLKRRNEIPLSDFSTAEPQPEVTIDNGENPCGGILAGKIPEEMPLVDGIHPCFILGEEQDPLGMTLSKRFPGPQTDY